MAEKKKNEWAEKLAYAPKNGYERLSAEEERAMHAYCEDYKDFLDHGKTERLCVEHCIELASARGFVPYEKGMALKTGDKVYYNNRGKAIMLAVIGEQDLTVRTSARRTPTRPAWTSSPARSTRKPRWPISRRTTTAASASTTG